MMMERRDLFRHLLLLLLPAVTWLFINATINRHDHSISNGYVISHAHPYEKTQENQDPVQSHQHSGTELFLLSLVSDPATTASIILILVMFLMAVMKVFRPHDPLSAPVRRLYQVHNYRAPPGC